MEVAASDQDHAKWEKLMAAGAECWREWNQVVEGSRDVRKYYEAIEHYKAAAELAEKFGPEDVRLGCSLARLGLVYDRFPFDDTERLLARALTILEKTPAPGDLEVLSCLRVYGGTFTLHRRESQAELEKALTQIDLEVASCLLRLGGIYGYRHKYAQAEQVNKRLLKIYERAFGLPHQEVVDLVQELGYNLREQRKYSEEERLYTWWLEAAEKALGPDDLRVITVVEQLGGCYYEQGRYLRAESLIKRAIASKERIGQSIAYSLYRLALVCDKQRRYKEAEELLRRSIGISEMANAVEALVQVLRKTGRMDEADKLEAQAKEHDFKMFD